MKSTRRTLCIAATAASLFVSTPALFAAAPTNNGPSGDQQTGKVHLSEQNQAFLINVWDINTTEIRLGQLAEQKATNDDVKAFAKRMVTDHSKLNTTVVGMASDGKAALPADINAKHQELTARLSKLSGSDFDKEYMTAMIEGHRKAVALVEKQANDPVQTGVDKWAAEVLPSFREHLQMAMTTGKEVGRTVPEDNAVPAADKQPGAGK